MSQFSESTQPALDYNSTIIGALELSERKWVLAVQLVALDLSPSDRELCRSGDQRTPRQRDGRRTQHRNDGGIGGAQDRRLKRSGPRFGVPSRDAHHGVGGGRETAILDAIMLAAFVTELARALASDPAEVVKFFAARRADKAAALEFLKRIMKTYGRPRTVCFQNLAFMIDGAPEDSRACH